MKSLVSVIVPCYNSEKYIDRCVQSIINQTYKNLEIILINDGSTDNTLNILNSYLEKDSRIKVINKPNGGVSSARNAGLKILTGEYVTFIDSDDYINEMFVELLLGVAANKIDVIRTKMLVDGKPFEKHTETYYIYDENGVYEKATYSHFLHHALYNSKLLYNNGKLLLFDTSLSLGEDTLFSAILLMRAKSFCFLNKELYYREINSNGLSSIKTINSQIEFFKSKEKIIEIAQQTNNKKAIAIAQINYYFSLKDFYYGLLNNKKENFIILKYIKKAVRRNLKNIFNFKLGIKVNLEYLKIAIFG